MNGDKQARSVIKTAWYTGLAASGFGGAALYAGAGIHSYALAFLSMGIVGTVLFITEFIDLTRINKSDKG